MQRVPACVPSGKNSVRTLVREPARRQDITAEQGPISLPLRRHQIRCDRNPYLERAPEDHLHCVRGLLPPLGVTRPLDPLMTTVFLKSQETEELWRDRGSVCARIDKAGMPCRAVREFVVVQRL